MPHLLHELGILTVLFCGAGANDVSSLHALMALGRDQRMAVSRLSDFGLRDNPRCARCANQISIEALPRADTSSTRSPVPEMDRDRVVRMSRRNPDRSANGIRFVANLRNIFVSQIHSFRSHGTDQRCVVPSEFGHRFGQFLKPSVVRKAAVENRGIGTKYNFKRRL